MISQIENEVNAELCKIGDVDIIELELPHIKDKNKKRDEIFETIHSIFDAEIIDNKLFIKVGYHFCFIIILHTFSNLLLLSSLMAGLKQKYIGGWQIHLNNNFQLGGLRLIQYVWLMVISIDLMWVVGTLNQHLIKGVLLLLIQLHHHCYGLR